MSAPQKNNKIIKQFAVIFLVSSLAVACVSQNKFERLTSDDCIVLIPTTLINKQDLPTARNYYLNFSDERERVEVGKDVAGYLPLLIRGPGLSITEISSDLDEGVKGGNFRTKLNILLPYERGQIIVTDFTFEQMLTKIDEYNYQSRWDFVETEADGASDCLDMFKERVDVRSWK